MPVAVSLEGPARDRLRPDERAELRRRFRRMARAAGLGHAPPLDYEVSLTLTGDEAVRALNRDYRGKDRPTDVLAFSQREGEGGDLYPELLGDVVISLETADRQRQRRGLLDEVLFLAAHGLCHLLGYDHQTDAEEAEMNARMERLLAEAERRGRTRPA